MVARSPPARVRPRSTRLPCRNLQWLERQRDLGDVRERSTAAASDPPAGELRRLGAGVVAGRSHDRVPPAGAHGRRGGRRRLPPRRQRRWPAEADLDRRGDEAARLVARRRHDRRRTRPGRRPHRRIDAGRQHRNGVLRRRSGMVARWTTPRLHERSGRPRRGRGGRRSSAAGRGGALRARPRLVTGRPPARQCGPADAVPRALTGAGRAVDRTSTSSGRTAADCGASLRRRAQNSGRAGARPCASGRR